jgi:hypothetical protein
MAINTDQLKKGNKGRGTSAPADTASGGDMALAVTSAVQGQANELAIAAQAASISIEYASEQMSEFFTQVMSGRALLGATLAKTQEKLQAQGSITINTDIPVVTVDLPALPSFGDVRGSFAGLFGGGNSGGYSPENPFLQPAVEFANDGEAND